MDGWMTAGYSPLQGGPLGRLAEYADQQARIRAGGWRGLDHAACSSRRPAIDRDQLFAVKSSLVAAIPAPGHKHSLTDIR